MSSEFIKQFNDLTEVRMSNLRMYNCRHFDYNDRTKKAFYFPDLVDGDGHLKMSVDTEFAFGVERQSSGALPNEMQTLGWKRINAMKNWYPAHLQDTYALVFNWWKNPKPKAPEEVKGIKRAFYDYTGEYTNLRGTLQQTGCGFKIGHLPLDSKQWYQFFTLLRLPLQKDLHRIHLVWLKQRNFIFVDEGTVSSFWVNGWPLKDWTWELEKAFWKKNDPNKKFVAATFNKDTYEGKVPFLDGAR